MNKSSFKGALFEFFCRLLMEKNGYHLIEHETGVAEYANNGRNARIIKMFGRGSKHQIDLPYDYSRPIPMLNDIRVIGEVKYYESAIGLPALRNFFGVVEDIKQNHFYSTSNQNELKFNRKLEQGLFISATGYTIDAQRYALAHNIKIMSVRDTPIILDLIKIIDEISNFIYELYDNKRIGTQEINEFLDDAYGHCYNGKFHDMVDNMQHDCFVERINYFFHFYNNIGSCFIGATSTGQLLLFISKTEFPENLFEYTDNVRVNILYYYDKASNEIDRVITMKIDDNIEFYVTIPSEIITHIEKEHKLNGNAINTKNEFLGKIHTIREINGIRRILTFIFDYEKLNDQRLIN